MKSSFCANSATDGLALIQLELSAIDCSADEPKKDKIESWLALKLLERLIETEAIQFPITLEGTDSSGVGYERPDFRISAGETRIGVEITEARHRDQAWAMDLSSAVNGACVELCHFRPNNKIDRKAGLKPHVVLPGKRLVGRGWNGFEAESEWCEYMIQSIQDKHTKLTEGGYHRFDEDWLLISDRTPVSMFIPSHLDLVCPILHERLMASCFKGGGGFHQIYVRCQSEIISFNKNGFRILRPES